MDLPINFVTITDLNQYSRRNTIQLLIIKFAKVWQPKHYGLSMNQVHPILLMFSQSGCQPTITCLAVCA
jgi:hypothetical protein